MSALHEQHSDLRLVPVDENEPGVHIQHPDLRMIPVGLHELAAREEESEGEPAEQDEHTPVVTADELLEEFEEMNTDDGL